jgi:hypothetical protein
MSYDRKAFSAEPQTAAAIMGKRWEDLIDAAASATEEDSRDLTPVSALTHRSFQFMLTVTGPTVPTILAPCQQPDLSPTLCCFALSVIHCFTIAEYIDPAAARDVRPAAVSFRRVFHRVGHIWSWLPHALTGPF